MGELNNMHSFGQSFPLSDYYKDCVIDALTLSRVGGWWSAVLVIRDPKSETPFIAFYRWQKSGDTWKTRKNFVIRNLREADEVVQAIANFSKYFK